VSTPGERRHRLRAAVVGRDDTCALEDGRLVFAALGFFAPIRCAALASLPRIVMLAAGGSVLIETAQYVLQPDRVSSVDDVLLNDAGAVAAALASRRWWRTKPESLSDQPHPRRHRPADGDRRSIQGT